jgi:hypothetical protein
LEGGGAEKLGIVVEQFHQDILETMQHADGMSLPSEAVEEES